MKLFLSSYSYTVYFTGFWQLLQQKALVVSASKAEGQFDDIKTLKRRNSNNQKKFKKSLTNQNSFR